MPARLLTHGVHEECILNALWYFSIKVAVEERVELGQGRMRVG